jgi:putative membrane protein
MSERSLIRRGRRPVARVAALGFGVAAASLSAALSAHTVSNGRVSDTGFGDSIGAFIALLLILIAAGLYAAGALRLEGRAPWSRLFAFYAGLAVLAASLLSPLDTWAAESFAVHMVQHELLMLAAAPLLVLGRPLPMFLWAFPPSSRIGLAAFFRRKTVRSAWALLSGAGAAWAFHALVLWIWHIPRYFNAAQTDRLTHDLQHITFVVSALLFWSALFAARRSAQQGAAIVYLFTTTIHTGVLGALIALASRPWYAEFLQPATRFSLTALEDQQLGGLIMWVPGSIVYVGAALALFARWISGPADPARAQGRRRHTPGRAIPGSGASRNPAEACHVLRDSRRCMRRSR